MMWLPYVEQIVDMVRQSHLFHYRLGPGYDAQTGQEEYFVKTLPVRALLRVKYCNQW